MAGGSADRKCFEAEIGNIFNLTWCITDVTLKSNLITGGNTMPTQSPRVNVVLDNVLYQNVRLLAEKDNVSLSAKVRDLLKEALEIQEDIVLSAFAEKREKSWSDANTLTHDDVWS